MRKGFFAVLLILWIVPLLGQEQPKNQPKWAEDWKRGLEEAKERKVPILIVIPSRAGSQGPIIYPKVLDDAQILQASENFVCFIADEKRFPDIEKRIAAEYHKGKFGFYGDKLQIYSVNLTEKR
ncbi:MAG: hypothetical protein N2234_00820 [Planctomycetota bacterium]|nr:hypothetical protein [Planctomycetota bacterium]